MGTHILQYCNTGITTEDFVKELTNSTLSMNHKCVIITTAWCIWRDRCMHVFQNQCLNKDATARCAIRLTNDMQQNTSAPLSMQDGITISNPVRNPRTGNLPQNCMLIFCDASYDLNTNSAGIGIVIIDVTGTYRGCKIQPTITRDSKEAESLAIWEAINWAKGKRLHNICILSDSKNVISYLLNKQGQTSWYSSSILDDCLVVKESFQFFEFQNIHRNFNSLVDKAAKHCRLNRVSGEWQFEQPHFITQNSVFDLLIN